MISHPNDRDPPRRQGPRARQRRAIYFIVGTDMTDHKPQYFAVQGRVIRREQRGDCTVLRNVTTTEPEMAQTLAYNLNCLLFDEKHAIIEAG